MAASSGRILPEADLGRRFKVVDLIPTLLTGATLIIILMWDQFSTSSDEESPWWWRVGLVAAVAMGVALVLRPLQIRLVRLLEGYWPDSALHAFIFNVGVSRQSARKAWLTRLARRARAEGEPVTRERAGWAVEQLRRYPQEDRLLPTRLGNALRAAEDLAGARYGMDPSWALPRLYPLLDEALRDAYDESVDQYDSSARLAVAVTLATVAATALITLSSGAWGLLATSGLFLAYFAYIGAVEAAAFSGELLVVIIDLHRFDLIEKLRVRLPNTAAAEADLNRELGRFFTSVDPQRRFPRSYRHATSTPNG